ncbi:MAG: SAM-dependent methyltransferase [Clostridiales bacterium]|nr:SAM-dependent methyltransferase [Clostridiales bacterium]
MEKITSVLCSAMDGGKLVKIVFAGKKKKSLEYKKVILRPVTIKGEYMCQAEFHYDKKVIHKNIPYYEAVDFAGDLIRNDFKQINILTEDEDIQILASKPDNPKITYQETSRNIGSIQHDRKKQYIIPDGEPCDFLIKLGVMSEDGKVVQKHYSKFRQINRFLEITDDSFESLPTQGTIRIIDFGCGKSYLTFALYYYLKLMKKRDVEIVGLDLKEDVIRFCNDIAVDLGYDDLKFITGDIADYESDGADMVVTLHACDTATDFALINAVKWHSKVILSVPCCQHELFPQIKNPVNQPILKHGIIKDKFTELLTDGLRGLKLEEAGYHVSMIEFTSLEHTSKNIMIKAVLPKSKDMTSIKKASEEYRALRDFYNVKPSCEKIGTISP